MNLWNTLLTVCLANCSDKSMSKWHLLNCMIRQLFFIAACSLIFLIKQTSLEYQPTSQKKILTEYRNPARKF